MARAQHGVITIDVRPLVRAWRRIVDSFVEMFTPAGQYRRRRARLGGMATDARRWPDQWQTTVCAGLLCSITQCPSDANDLGCTHKCHGGAS